MGTVVILTGPAGAGKNTIARLVAGKRKRCAVIDVDLVRWMLVKPHVAPWEGREGTRQQKLGVHNACMLTKQFLADGCDVLIHDVITNETLSVYRYCLKEHHPHIVLLLPSLVEIEKRNKQRPPRLKNAEIKLIYHWQEELQGYDIKIDNTLLTSDEVAERIDFLLEFD